MCFQPQIKKHIKFNWAFEDKPVWHRRLGNARRQHGLQKYVYPISDSVGWTTVFIILLLGFFTHTLFHCLWLKLYLSKRNHTPLVPSSSTYCCKYWILFLLPGLLLAPFTVSLKYYYTITLLKYQFYIKGTWFFNTLIYNFLCQNNCRPNARSNACIVPSFTSTLKLIQVRRPQDESLHFLRDFKVQQVCKHGHMQTRLRLCHQAPLPFSSTKQQLIQVLHILILASEKSWMHTHT